MRFIKLTQKDSGQVMAINMDHIVRYWKNASDSGSLVELTASKDGFLRIKETVDEIDNKVLFGGGSV